MPYENIFKAQTELMHKYHDIEVANNALETDKVPVDIQSREGQARLRRFAWFITEEVVETLEAKYSIAPLQTLHEELSDILHFMTEWAILSGVGPQDLPEKLALGSKEFAFLTRNSEYTQKASEVVYWVGRAISLLKGKPWKQSYKPTDEAEYQNRVVRAYEALLTLMHHSGIDIDDLDPVYFRKNEINQSRIQGGY